MDGMYGLNSTDDYSDKSIMSPENLIMAAGYTYSTYISPNDHYHHHRINMFGGSDDAAAAAAVSEVASMAPADIRRAVRRCDGGDEYDEDDVDEEACSIIKAKIASHPSYRKLLNAYIDCQKVGAPREIAYLLEEMSRENAGFSKGNANSIATTCFGADPELDEFMETYCNILVKCKSDLSRPFDEATMFLNTIEIQLGNLCKDNDGAISSSDEELSGGETDGKDFQSKNEDRELKERLMRKYGNHISSLKLEFSKKKKKGKLPKEARQTLLEWWNVHYKWPYPTEADKMSLANSTGLDQKQINNWFINQRKRHWKPSENMQLAVMDSLSGQFYVDD